MAIRWLKHTFRSDLLIQAARQVERSLWFSGSALTLLCCIGCGGSANGMQAKDAGGTTITGITAGSGLTGGGISGNVTIAVDGTVARTNSNQVFGGNMTVDGSRQNGIDFGEVAFAPNDQDVASSPFEQVGSQMHFRLSRAYCDKRSNSQQSAFDQANFFCPPVVPDAVVIDDQHPPSSTPNHDFIIAPYQNGMSMFYPGNIEIASDSFSVRGTNFTQPAPARLNVGDNNDEGGFKITAHSVLNSSGQVDRTQSFIEQVSETFNGQSHGDMLFIVRDVLDGFRFLLVPTGQDSEFPNGGYKPFTVARIDGTGKGFFDGGMQTGGADFAESISAVRAKVDYQPGDVLVIDRNSDRQFLLSSSPYSTLAAGIYSTKPGVVATSHNADDPRLAAEIPMAIVGIVSCKVSAENGPISRGDLLVTSSTPGYAMRGTDPSLLPGAIIGKALQPLSEGKGKIDVLVTLR